MNKKVFFGRSALLAIFVLALLLLAPAHSLSVAAQELSVQQRTELCKEKKQGLSRLENEAVELRAQIPKYEQFLRELPNLSQTEIDARLSICVTQIENIKEALERTDDPAERKKYERYLAFWRAGMDLYSSLKTENIAADPDLARNPLVRNAESALKTLRERQTEVGRQIFLVRDSVESLRCSEVEGFAGTWLFRGYPNAVCTIELTGDKRLKAVTEKGVVGYGYFIDQRTIVVDFPFARGLRGWLTEDGSRISWGNREFWVRAQ